MTLSNPTPARSRSAAYDRPAARFTDDQRLDVRASALGQCRRALWYAATGQTATNPMTDETKLVLEAGQALEPVVVRAMQRTFWTVTPSDPEEPWRVEVEAGAGLVVSGHPDATGAIELFGDERVIEVKTRGPEAFKRWQTLGAERSHPESVAQAACYSLGLYGEVRDVVIATLDTGSRQWDYEVVPAARAERAWDAACLRLSALADHHEACGPDPEALPERDFEASDWQCRRCPYLNLCLPGEAAAEAEEDDQDEAEPVSDEAAQAALRDYEQAQSQDQGVRPGQAHGAQDPPALARNERRTQSQAGGLGQDPHGRDGRQPPLRGRPPAAQRAARPRAAGRDRDRANLGVRPRQLTQHRTESTPARRAHHGAALPHGTRPRLV